MSSRAARCIAFAAATVAASASSCAQKPQVNFNVFLPDALANDTKWIEVGVFPGGCPESKALVGGLPPDGTVARVAFRRGDPSPPVGDLKKGPYAFAAVARGQDCSVLANGCAVVNVNDVRDVNIDLKATPAPEGACTAGATCQSARCVPGIDNSDPSIGSGCSLQLLGAGPLGDPLSFGGTVLSAPAIAATDTGFMIAYREYDPLLGAARLSLVPIDSGGGAHAAQATTLPGRCPGSEESDATAMAFVGGAGLIALARAPCGGKGGVDLFKVDSAANVTQSGFSGAGASKVTLASARALTPSGGAYLLAFSLNGETHVVQVNGVALDATAPPFGGAAPQDSGWVTTSDKVVALLASGSGTAPVGDGGASEGGASGATLRLSVAASGQNLGALGAPLTFEGNWGSLAALGTRVMVVSDSTAPGRSVAWRAFDLGGAAATATEAFSTLGLGKALYADVALAKDRAFFAVEQPGSISLVVYNHATTAPAFLREIFLPRDPRIPAMTTLRDGRVAVAASDTRVAVVWTTAKTMFDNDVVGGYAVFACTF